VDEAAADLGADRLQLAGVDAEPGDPEVPELVGVVRDLTRQPRRQMSLGGLEDVRHLGEQRREAGDPGAAAEEGHQPDDDEGEGGDDEHGQDDHRPTFPRRSPAAHERQLLAEDVHQLVGRIPPEERRQQVEVEDQEEGQRHQEPGGDLDRRRAARLPEGAGGDRVLDGGRGGWFSGSHARIVSRLAPAQVPDNAP